jgi:hypothetical protein
MSTLTQIRFGQLLGMLVAWQATSACTTQPAFNRETAQQLIVESLRAPSAWTMDGSCPHQVANQLSRAEGPYVTDPKVTGVTGDGLERSGLFRARIRIQGIYCKGAVGPSCTWEGTGEGDAKYQLYDDGWRLVNAHIATCTMQNPLPPGVLR